MNKDTLKNIVYLLGKTLGLVGVIFVFYTLYQEYTLSSFTQQFFLFLDILPLLLIFNILSILLGIYAWHLMLLHYSSKKFPYLTSYYYFAKTEIAKYLPGNVFHFVGRQALASRIGITQTQMAKSSLLFSLLLLTGTLFVSTLFAFFVQSTPLYILLSMGLFSIISLIALTYFYPSFPLKNKISLNIYLALSVAFQSTILAWIVIHQSDAFSMQLFLQCAGIYTISWLIGFITPGASGGLGVREGTFITIVTYLHINISPEVIIFSVLLVRLINICVDVIMYFSTIIVEKKMKESEL